MVSGLKPRSQRIHVTYRSSCSGNGMRVPHATSRETSATGDQTPGGLAPSPPPATDDDTRSPAVSLRRHHDGRPPTSVWQSTIGTSHACTADHGSLPDRHNVGGIVAVLPPADLRDAARERTSD